MLLQKFRGIWSKLIMVLLLPYTVMMPMISCKHTIRFYGITTGIFSLRCHIPLLNYELGRSRGNTSFSLYDSIVGSHKQGPFSVYGCASSNHYICDIPLLIGSDLAQPGIENSPDAVWKYNATNSQWSTPLYHCELKRHFLTVLPVTGLSPPHGFNVVRQV